jgi:threonine/homoserine/homoserine lactone efflux protein
VLRLVFAAVLVWTGSKYLRTRRPVAQSDENPPR